MLNLKEKWGLWMFGEGVEAEQEWEVYIDALTSIASILFSLFFHIISDIAKFHSLLTNIKTSKANLVSTSQWDWVSVYNKSF